MARKKSDIFYECFACKRAGAQMCYVCGTHPVPLPERRTPLREKALELIRHAGLEPEFVHSFEVTPEEVVFTVQLHDGEGNRYLRGDGLSTVVLEFPMDSERDADERSGAA